MQVWRTCRLCLHIGELWCISYCLRNFDFLEGRRHHPVQLFFGSNVLSLSKERNKCFCFTAADCLHLYITCCVGLRSDCHTTLFFDVVHLFFEEVVNPTVHIYSRYDLFVIRLHLAMFGFAASNIKLGDINFNRWLIIIWMTRVISRVSCMHPLFHSEEIFVWVVKWEWTTEVEPEGFLRRLGLFRLMLLGTKYIVAFT